MPLLCGLETGVVTGLRPNARANERVSAAVRQLPLTVSHSIPDGAMA
jgi:hypothetical protein